MSNSTQGLAVLVFLAGATVVGIGGLEGSLLLALVGIAGIAASVPLFLRRRLSAPNDSAAALSGTDTERRSTQTEEDRWRLRDLQ